MKITNDINKARAGGRARAAKTRTQGPTPPGGVGDYLLDEAVRRRLEALDRSKDRPWVPIRPRWIDTQPDPRPIRARYLAAHPRDQRPCQWVMPRDERFDTYAGVTRRGHLTAEQYERMREAQRAGWAKRAERLGRTPQQQKMHDEYLARKARREQGR